MIDIQEGDILLVGEAEYPIRSVERWDVSGLSSLAFQRLARVTASTKRPPALSATGTRGAPVVHLVGIRITPLDPVDAELRAREKLNTPHNLLTCFVESDPYLHLTVEELRK
jgi:hypothetical protein